MPFLAEAQAPSGYYDGTSTLTGYVLKSKLHQIISEKNINWHYGDLTNFYNQTDLDKYYDHDASNTTILLDIYSEIPNGSDSYEYTTANIVGSASAEGQGWNREHMMPQSTFNSNYPMYSDLFYVIPTDARINQLRSNYPYGIAKASTTPFYTFTNGSKINTNATAGSGYSGRVYEPIDEFKGDIARSLLYFITRYEDKLQSFDYNDNNNPQDGSSGRGFDQWYINLLMLWHQNDPVSAKEIARNNYAYVYQKNRNPYIDHPEWVTEIWTSTLSTTDLASFEKTLSVYPNPVRNGELNVSGYGLNEVKTLQIYSIDGKLVQTVNQDLKNNRKIILKNITKGNYILKAENQSVKFIVQ